MLLTLNNNEIESAIKVYVESQGVSTTNKQVTVTLTAKRGDGKGGKGTMEAIIDISEATDNSTVTTAQVNTEESTAKSLFGQNEEE